MNPRPYLPSLQFSLIVLSLLGASGLIYAAQVTTTPAPPASIASTAPDAASAATDHSNWASSLAAIQAQEGSSSLPAAPDQDLVGQLLQGAQTQNLTDTVGRTLLISLTNAQAQGLGADTPTQNTIISQALSQIAPPQPSIIYTAKDLTIVADSGGALHSYGAALVAILAQHPEAGVGQTLTIIGSAVNGDPSKLPELQAIGAGYRALAKDLAAVAVPQSLAATHLQAVNDFEQMSEAYPAMEAIQGDPVRGLSGLQQFNTLESDAQNLFIKTAQTFAKNGILFTTQDDPQGLWASLLSG